jgi:hypothetical protein
MAADGSWPGIARHGLLSTTALLDLFEIDGDVRFQIEAQRRPASVPIAHPANGRAVIRDNKPLLEGRLQSCLEGGMTPEDWYRHLNRRVFFWPTRSRVETLLGAAAYSADPQVVLTLSTARLVSRYGDAITLSTINSGATRPFAWPRGPATFQPLSSFDFTARRRHGRKAIAEVAVDYAVTDMTKVTKQVARHLPDGTTELLWTA